jgi:hypothetical protein
VNARRFIRSGKTVPDQMPENGNSSMIEKIEVPAKK